MKSELRFLVLLHRRRVRRVDETAYFEMGEESMEEEEMRNAIFEMIACGFPKQRGIDGATGWQ